MPRMYTRLKRKLQLTSSFKHRFRNVKAKHGTRTFSTKEAADAYAKDVLKVKDYSVEPAKKNKRFKIVSE